MVCPFCNAEDTAVVDSRKNVDGDAIRRRRECSVCSTRFTTYEKSEIELIVKKRNGNLEEIADYVQKKYPQYYLEKNKLLKCSPTTAKSFAWQCVEGYYS